jgi:uncharacterized protein (TIGR02145 family)
MGLIMKAKFFRKKTNRLPFSVLLLCPVVLPAQDVIQVSTSTSYSIRSTTDAIGNGLIYKWMENGVELPDAADATYTNPLGKAIAGEYTYVRLAKSPDCETWLSSNTFKVVVNNAVTESYDTFQNFTIRSLSLQFGGTLTLTDARDNKTYVVKKMDDYQIWMVQDLKFGNCVDDATTTWHNDNSRTATTHTPTIADGYVGHCRAVTVNGQTVYLYNWPAAIQSKNAYYGSSDTAFHCLIIDVANKLPPSTPGCRGICPTGWHLPIVKEFRNLYRALPNAVGLGNDYVDIDNIGTHWHGVLGGYCNSSGSLQDQGKSAHYWTSTYNSSYNAYDMYFNDEYDVDYEDYNPKNQGRAVRCVLNP